MAYLTNIFLSLQVEFFHTPAIIWGTFLPTKNSTSYISSSAKSKISVKHLCVILSWYLISEFTIQKYKDYNIQNYILFKKPTNALLSNTLSHPHFLNH
jgi:hypothetical protein